MAESTQNLPQPQFLPPVPPPASVPASSSSPFIPPAPASAQPLAPAPAPATDTAPTPAPAPATDTDTAPAPALATDMDTATAPAPVITTHNPIPEHLMHKNRLQEYTQRSSIQFPVYQTINEGYPHAPRFRSTVFVDGASYTSNNTFSHRKAAEQEVAKIALEDISKKLKNEGCPLISEDPVFCKSILNEFAVKMNLEKPIYSTMRMEGLLPTFVSSLVFGGITYTGKPGRSKKEAEQLAARAVILSLLGTSGSATFLSEIIKSKIKLYAALHKVEDFSHGAQVIGANTGQNSEISVSKVVEATPATSYVPTGAALETSSGTHPPHHEFKMPKPEPSCETMNLPISFVPPVSLQPSIILSSSSNKRRRNKKKANKKLRSDAQLSIAAQPFSQAPSCSVAQ